MSYDKNYRVWEDNQNLFWEKKAGSIYWHKKWQNLIVQSQDKRNYQWFHGGMLNTSYNCIDRHVEAGMGDKIAIIYDSPITKKKKNITYNKLLKKVQELAFAMHSSGLKKGDRVIIYMPMIPEVIYSMLACARIGLIHSVVFGGFAAEELASRINDAKPKLILTSSCGIEPNRIIDYKDILNRAIEKSIFKPAKQVIFQREEYICKTDKKGDVEWNNFIEDNKKIAPIPVESSHPLYILYTSGTTGIPKGIVRDTGGHAVALYNSMKMTYGITKNDVFWAASDVGWVVGHSYIVYAPLLIGCTTILYEGKPIGTPDAGQFWRVIEEYNVNVLFTAPTAIRAIKKEDPECKEILKYDIKSLNYIFLAGERADPETVKWTMDKTKIPVIDHWWQTETGWSIAGNFSEFGMFPIKNGSTGKAAPGYKVLVLDDKGKDVGTNTMGNLAIRLPLPPGCSTSIWGDSNRFYETYLEKFKGYYNTSDAGIIDEENYISVMSRTDDIINCAGHRISTGSIEEILTSHGSVAECAVVGIFDKIKGEVPVGLIVLKSNHKISAANIQKQTVELVREKLGPVASYKKTFIVENLPKTRSGKILRKTISKILNKLDYDIPATIEDKSALAFIEKIDLNY